ncbi:hypothetical protein GCM10027018_12660 [Paenibacillus thermoaerophilus]
MEERPEPSVTEHPRRVQVKVSYSLISPGTELGLLANPAVPDGFALGYSAAGVVQEVGSAVEGFKPGDYVACYGGPYVYHAETLSVPEMLCVKLSGPELLREAAFVGLGSVAVHSVRRLSRQFGETVWVAGLGVLGLLIAQLGDRANYRVFATDMKDERLQLAKACGVEDAYRADDPQLAERIRAYTDGHGFDSIALCAHSANPKLIESCMQHLAFRGTFALIGNVPIQFSRDLFFAKEADFVIARGAGPGRYDRQYEEECLDYPKSYVRWTEGRNMQEFIRNVENGRVAIRPMVTHEFALGDAVEAYEMLKREASSALGVLIRYAE